MKWLQKLLSRFRRQPSLDEIGHWDIIAKINGEWGVLGEPVYCSYGEALDISHERCQVYLFNQMLENKSSCLMACHGVRRSTRHLGDALINKKPTEPPTFIQ